jgi:hypothetical protein
MDMLKQAYYVRQFERQGVLMATLKSERAELKSAGARPHPNSGRGKIAKGDGSTGDLIIDVKEASKSFTLNVKVWTKICTDAFKTNADKSPALLIVLGEENQPKVRLAVVEWSLLESLLEVANEHNRHSG